jgi:FdhE protein
VQLQGLVREATRIEPLVRDYYARTARPDRYQPAAPDVPAMLDEVAAITLGPFLARCAEAWRPHINLSDYHEGWCPMCGLLPDFATLVDGERVLICGRCRTQWAFPSHACPFCAEAGAGDVSSFATRDGRYRVYGCNRCRKYLKAYDPRGGSRPVLPAVDTIATLPLDAAAIQRGYDG